MKFYFSMLLVFFSFGAVAQDCPQATGLYTDNYTFNSYMATVEGHWDSMLGTGVKDFLVKYKHVDSLQWNNLSNLDSTSTSKVIGLLDFNTTYVWSVVAYCSEGSFQDPAEWAVVDTFTTLAYVDCNFDVEITHSLTVPPNNICNGVASVTSTTGTPPFEYVWSDDNAQTTQTAVNLCGNQTYSVTVTDANGCESSALFSIDVEDCNFEIGTTTVNQPECFDDFEDGEILIENFSGGIPPYTVYVYNDNLLFSEQTTNADFINIQNLPEGNYNISIESSNGCQEFHAFTITVPEDIVVNSIVTPPSCVGGEDGSIYITSVSGGNGGYNYLWSPAGMLTDNVTSLSAGTYNLFLFDQEGCEHVEIFSIDDPQEVDIELIVSDETCNNADDGTLAANFSIPFAEIGAIQWYVNGLPISAIDGGQSSSIVGLSAGSYSVEITTVNGCVFSSSASVGEPSPIELSVESTNPICFNSNDGTILAIGSGGASAFSYEVINGVGSIASNSSLTENLIADTYTVTAINDNNCQISETVVLSNPNDIILNIFSSNVTCHNGNDGAASYSSTNSQVPFNQTWYSVIALNDYVPISFESSLSDLSAGNYLLEFVDGVGCVQSEIFTITEPVPIVVSPTIDPSSCSNVDGLQAQVVSTGASPVNYLWTVNQNDVITVSGNVVTDLMPGSIFVTGTDANGCSLPLIEVIVPEPITENVIFGNPDPEPFSSHFYSASDNGNTLLWSVQGGNIIENNGNSVNIQWGNQGIGLITLVESNEICDYTNIFTVNIESQIEPTWDCLPDPFYCVEFYDGSGNFQSSEECEANCNATSIDENDLEVKIYPNPSSNIFNLEFSPNSETEILVTNILGEQIYFESIKSIGDISTQIDLSDYSKGVYNLSIRSSVNISNHKLILH